MKFRKLLGGGLLAAVLALGGVAGLATHSESKEIDATNLSSIYLMWGDSNNVWDSWNASASDIKVHFFNGDTGYDTWPGVGSSETITVDGIQYLKFDVPNSNATTIIMNAWGGDDWKPQNRTGSLTLPTNGSNMFQMTSWENNSNQTGDWYELDTTSTYNGYYLRGDWENGWIASGQKHLVDSGDGHVAENVPLSAWGHVKVVNYYNCILKEWVTPDYVSPTQDEGEEFYVGIDGDGNAYVSEDGVYTITLYWAEENSVWKPHLDFVRTEDPNLTAAVNFANNFVNSMKANCPHTSEGGSSSKVATAWGAQITLYTSGDLSAEAKTYLTTSAGDSVKDITDFWSSYDYIYGHYASVRALQGANFLGRTISISANLSPISIIGNTDNTTPIMLVVIISVVSLTAVGGYIFLKRRKED